MKADDSDELRSRSDSRGRYATIQIAAGWKFQIDTEKSRVNTSDAERNIKPKLRRTKSEPFFNSWDFDQRYLIDEGLFRRKPRQDLPVRERSSTESSLSSMSGDEKNIQQEQETHVPSKSELNTKSVFDNLEGPDFIVRTSKRGHRVISAASKEKLLRCLIEEAWEDPSYSTLGRPRSDSNVMRRWKKKYEEYQAKGDGDMFVVYFIFTHTYFMTTVELLDELIKHYHNAIEKTKTNLPEDEKAVFEDIKKRIVLIVKRWMFYSIDDLLEMKRSELLLSFMNGLEKSGSQDQFSSLSRVYKIALLHKDTSTPNAELDKKELKIKKMNSIEDAPEVYVARQMALMDLKAFCGLKTHDLIHKNWSTSAACTDINHTFTAITLWVATEILSLPNLKHRTSVLAKLISLGKELLNLNNFQGAAAIHSGLSLPCVARLERTWKTLEESYPKCTAYWNELSEVFSPFHNFENYRDRIKKSNSPIIPWHFIYWKDLADLEEHYKDKSHGLINWKKLRKIGRVIMHIKKYQQSVYTFAVNPIIHEFLSKKLYVLDLDKLNELSRKYESSLEMPRRSELDLAPRLQRRMNKAREQSDTIRVILDSSAPMQPYRKSSFLQPRDLSEKPTDPVADALVQQPMHLIDALCDITTTEAGALDAAKSIVDIFEVRNQSLMLMKKMVFYDIEKAHLSESVTPSTIANLYKNDNSFPNIVLRQFCMTVGKSYLAKTFGNLVKKLNSQKSMELDPTKLTKKDDIKANTKAFLKFVYERVIQSLFGCVDDCPYPIRVLCFDIKKEVLVKTKSKELSLRAALLFFCYRLILPAIINPEIHTPSQKNPPTRETKRALQLIVQALRSLLSPETAPPEPFLADVVAILSATYNKSLREFIDRIISEIPDSSYDFNVFVSANDQQQASDNIRNFVVNHLEFIDSKIPNPKLLNCFVLQKVFGYPLYAVIRREATGTSIPTILEKCTKFIIEQLKGGKLEGLFRISGEASKVNALKTAFDNGEYVDLKNADPYVVADVIKLYFKSLPDSLIPSQYYDRMLSISGIDNKEKRKQEEKVALSAIPPLNYKVLKFIVRFMKELTNYSETTMMSIHNLALMFGPNLLRPPTAAEQRKTLLSFANEFIEDLMEYYDELFK